MHLPLRIRYLGAIVVLTLSFSLAGRECRSATLTWDNNGSTAPNPQDGAGTWSGSSATWWSGSTDQTWANANGDTAQFGFGSGGANAYTVTLASSQSVGGLTFQNNAYTLAGTAIRWPWPVPRP